MSDAQRRGLRLRAIVLFWAFCSIAGALSWRLFTVQVRDAPGLAAFAGQEQRGTFDVSGRRGQIVDRFGEFFAESVPSAAIYAQPPDVIDPHREAAVVAKLLGRPAPAIETLLRSKTTFVYLARNAPQALGARINRLALHGIGALDEPTGLRIGPQGRVGSTVVGFTGVDNQGLAGIEYEFNDVLAGKPGKVIEDMDSAGRPIAFGRRIVEPPVIGGTVALTIDRVLQYAADEILARTVREHHAADGTIIVVRAQTGEILALANFPNFDPNHYAAAPEAARRNRAITDPYEPGSTFKVVTAVAALDSGRVTLDDRFPAVNSIRVGGYVIHNAVDGLPARGGGETLTDIVTLSHNVGAAEVALRVGKRTMHRYLQRFRFGAASGIDLPGESPGIVSPLPDWWGSQLATIGFGQGISVTALQLAFAYAAVANGGVLMRPLIVRDVSSARGRIVKEYRPQVVGRVMRPQTSAKLMAMLRNVVRRGTGKRAQVPGFPVAGKTGTAQMVIDGAYVGGAYTSSFVGIIPADKPQYVVLVKIDQPQGAYYGGLVAAPAFRELARRIFWRESILPRNDVATSQGNAARAR